MRLALRLSDTLAVERSLAPVLSAIAESVVEAFEAALARVWLMGPGDRCAECPMRPECADRARCLHLAASAGLSRRLDGPFRRYPLGARRVGEIAITLEPYVVRGDLSSLGLADAAWLSVHRVRGFAAFPLLVRDELLGVMATFVRREWGTEDADALALAARLAANAIAAARPPEQGPDSGASAPPAAAQPAHLRPIDDIERDAILRVLEHTGWRVAGARGAAAILALPPSTLASRMQRLGIRRPPRP